MTTKYQYNLVAFRDKHGLTQQQAAVAFGVTTRTWCRHEYAGAVPLLWYYAIVGYQAIKGGSR